MTDNFMFRCGEIPPWVLAMALFFTIGRDLFFDFLFDRSVCVCVFYPSVGRDLLLLGLQQFPYY